MPNDGEARSTPSRPQRLLLVEDENFWRHQENGLAVFPAPDFSRVYKLPLALAEEAVVGPHFHIKPLLPILDDAGPFRL